MMNRPLVIITLCFAGGIVLGMYIPSALVVAALTLFFIASLIQIIRTKQLIIPLLLFFLAAGALACQLSMQAVRGNIRDYAGKRGVLLGVVAGEPLWREDEVVFCLQPQAFELQGRKHIVSGQTRVVLRLLEDAPIPDLFYGQQLLLQGTLYEPSGKRNPGGFDYRFFLERQGIAATFYASAAVTADLGLSKKISYWQRFLYSVRTRVQEIFNSSLPVRESSLLRGIFLGERSAVPSEMVLSFQRAGVAHLLAVSGLHLGLLAALLWGLGRRFFFKGWAAFFLLLGITFLYAAVTGMRPATLRAFLMLALTLGAYQLGRKKDLPTAVAFAALITLLYNPLLLFDVGFQLSYASTVALIALTRPLASALTFLPRYLRELVALSFAAQLGVLPLTAYYFNQVSLIALLTNVLLLPVMSFIVGLAFVGAVAGFFWLPLGLFFCSGTYPLLLYLGWGATALGHLPGAYCKVQGLKKSYLFLAYCLPLLLSLFRHYRNRRHSQSLAEGERGGRSFSWAAGKKQLIACLLLLLVVFIWLYPPRGATKPLEVVFLDVGQGDAIFIETPDGCTALIDGGGRLPFRGDMEWTGENVILPYLKERGVDKLDVVMISHPHEDHFGGLFPVIREKDVDLVLISPDPGDSPHYHELLALMESRDISRKIAGRGDRLLLGEEVFFTFYLPAEKLFQGTGSDANNNSLVKKMTYGQTSFLFTGDIEEEAAAALLRSGDNLQSDVLKIPHHGGYFASVDKFLQAVEPAAGIICVGNNSFGHPNSYLLQSLEQHGVEVYRTDYHGAVTVTSDGRRIYVRPFLSDKTGISF
jgi:competence protein ComEC